MKGNGVTSSVVLGEVQFLKGLAPLLPSGPVDGRRRLPYGRKNNSDETLLIIGSESLPGVFTFVRPILMY
jgi:hypothetical protein